MTVRDLTWTPDARNAHLRIPRFARRPPVLLETVAALVRSIERRISEILVATRVDVFPPVVLEAGQWPKLCAGAHVFEVTRDLTLVIARRDARRIVSCAFGETPTLDSDDPLSPLEARVLARFIEELATGLQSVCSPGAQPHAVYCEIRLSGSLDAIIGVATSETTAIPGPRLTAAALEDCPIECSVRLGSATTDIFTIANLAIGDMIRLETKVGPSATLNLGRDPIAIGEGGVLGNRTAFKVHECR